MVNRPSGPDFGRTATRKTPKSAIRPAEGQPEIRFLFFPGSSPSKFQPGRPIYGPEALLRNIEYTKCETLVDIFKFRALASNRWCFWWRASLQQTQRRHQQSQRNPMTLEEAELGQRHPLSQRHRSAAQCLQCLDTPPTSRLIAEVHTSADSL